MGYTFRSLVIRNFKYITDEKPLEFDFSNRNIVILDGQNGYGKTTLFDAIEILLTGNIKHFNQDLQNRGKETLGTLANNENKDIIISAVLANESINVTIERKLLCKEEFKSLILFNDREIQQEELCQRLQYSLSMFNIGIYISQSQSLDFLQNKYKERKAQVSSLVDNSEINNKIISLKNMEDLLHERVDSEIKEKEHEIKKIEENITHLKNQVENISINLELPAENIKLFEKESYPFDDVKIDDKSSFDAIITPLRQIGKFIENFDEYLKCLNNSLISEVQEISKKTYMALFFKKEISLLIAKEDLLKQLIKCRELLTNYNESKWTIDEPVFGKIGVDKSVAVKVKGLLLRQQTEKNQLDESDKVLAQMEKARQGLVTQFKAAVDVGKFEENKCPFCGTNIEDIDRAIKDTEAFIRNIHTDNVSKVENTEKEIHSIFMETIIPCLKQFLEDNKYYLQVNDSLSGCKALDTNKLEQLLNRLGMSEFESHEEGEFDIQEFSDMYDKLQETIKNKITPIKIDLSGEEIALFKIIHQKYYHNERPKHTVNDIQKKEQYIARVFTDKLSRELIQDEEKVKKLKENYEKYNNKTNKMKEAVSSLINKYQDANKDYQTQIANAIKIPLLVYSGRIIQNYPLGLGIRAVVKTNQLVFEAMSKNGNDVYNILSTGQLNGLSIAFLLSIKNVYGSANGLDILLIDDPLQTIDDISAISLADLLTQQGIGQIVLSTHEDAKANLLRYKFTQAGLSVLEKNMQQLYMETVMGAE